MSRTKAPSMLKMLLDPQMPLPQRRELLGHLCRDENPECLALVQSLLEAAVAGSAKELETQKLQELSALLAELKNGPLRPGTFIGLLPGHGPAARAHVVLPDGSNAIPVVPDAELAAALRCGDSVVLDAQGRALLYHVPGEAPLGEEARLERRLADGRVAATLRDERHFFRASAALRAGLDAGEVAAGARLLVCPRRQFAFEALPPEDGLSHYCYLVKEGPPDVVIERDIGAPPPCLDELAEHVRMEMLAPEVGRRYRLRRAVMKLLCGVSGSGKTLTIQGFWRRMYDIMAEVTGTPVARLPPRVMRLRLDKVLSKWLGESDKQLGRFFDEVDQLADELFRTEEGAVYELPVLAVFEEVDGLGRTRGEEAVYDRIMTTLLQRLDTTAQKLGDKLVIFLFTTNVPHLVDPAFLRRAGGTTEHFGRLNRRAFGAVLGKHLRGLPFAGDETEPAAAQRQAVRDVTAWLFSPNGPDKGQVELTFVGSANPVLKYRRDFLTGALVDRAVQQAAAAACRAERQGQKPSGLTLNLLLRAFADQVRGTVEQLQPHNVSNYLTLPDGVRVASLRRLEQPALLAFELEKAS